MSCEELDETFETDERGFSKIWITVEQVFDWMNFVLEKTGDIELSAEKIQIIKKIRNAYQEDNMWHTDKENDLKRWLESMGITLTECYQAFPDGLRDALRLSGIPISKNISYNQFETKPD